MGAGARHASARRDAGLGAAHALHRPAARARPTRGAGRRGRASLSVAGRDLRARAARSAARAARRSSCPTTRAAERWCARRAAAGRGARRRRRAGARHRARARRPAGWRAAAGAAAVRVRATYGGDVVCAQLEAAVPRNGRVTPLSALDRRQLRRPGAQRRRAACATTLEAIVAQADGRPLEIIVVDDRQRRRIVGAAAAARARSGRCGSSPAKGAAPRPRSTPACARRAIRSSARSIRTSRLQPGWMPRWLRALDDPGVAAAQGYYATDPTRPLCARAMGLDLEQRYAAIGDATTDHVCTGNSAYRADGAAPRRAVRRVARLRLRQRHELSAAGRRLPAGVLSARRAASTGGATDCGGYLVQQYGFGYGRIDLVAKHPRRFAGDSVSPAAMMVHPLLMALALASVWPRRSPAARIAPWHRSAHRRGALSACLAARTARRRRPRGAAVSRSHRAGFSRCCICRATSPGWRRSSMWSVRASAARPGSPSHSMRPERRDRSGCTDAPPAERAADAASTRARSHSRAQRGGESGRGRRRGSPRAARISTFSWSTTGRPMATSALLRASSACSGCVSRSASASAARCAPASATPSRLGYDVAVRLDGDGQHGADDIERLLAPLRRRRRRRRARLRATPPAIERASRTARAPTRWTGACSAAVSVDADRHARDRSHVRILRVRPPRDARFSPSTIPTGYPEPELRLFLSRNALRVIEVPVRARPRLSGTHVADAGTR